MGNIDDAMLHSAFESNFHLKRQHVNIMRVRDREETLIFDGIYYSSHRAHRVIWTLNTNRIDPQCRTVRSINIGNERSTHAALEKEK